MNVCANHVERARVAYLRTAGAQQPSTPLSSLQQAYGRQYVVLRNVAGVLAVYRILPISKTLKRIPRWPAVLSQHARAETAQKVKPTAIGLAPAFAIPTQSSEKESA